jgi:hypothetical protein
LHIKERLAMRALFVWLAAYRALVFTYLKQITEAGEGSTLWWQGTRLAIRRECPYYPQ